MLTEEDDDDNFDSVSVKPYRYLDERTHDLSGISEKSDEESRPNSSVNTKRISHLVEKESSEDKPSTIDSKDYSQNATPGTEGELEKLKKIIGNNGPADLSQSFFSPID